MTTRRPTPILKAALQALYVRPHAAPAPSSPPATTAQPAPAQAARPAVGDTPTAPAQVAHPGTTPRKRRSKPANEGPAA